MMALTDIFAELEAAVADGIVKRYAVGGAVGATFYIEPAATQDVDVFVVLDQSAALLVSLTPIYDYFTARGAVVDHEHLVIAEWPVQFLPSGTFERLRFDDVIARFGLTKQWSRFVAVMEDQP